METFNAEQMAKLPSVCQLWIVVGCACWPSPAFNADVRLYVLGNEMGGARSGVPDDEHVALHRLQISQCVQQGFTLAGSRCIDVDVQHIG